MKKLLLIVLLASAPFCANADEATTTPDIATSTPEIATSTPAIATSTPAATSTITLTIRDGNLTVFSGDVDIAASTSPAVSITPTNASTSVSVAADSLLATVVSLDAMTDDFEITDLAYFSSFDSFIINCISSPAATTTNCFNWTYAVNGAFPQVGIDDTILHDGDMVHLFFGPSRQTALSTSTATIGEEFTATAQRYDLDSGAYVGVPSVIVGVGIANPDFTFTEFATSTTDANGNAIFTMSATGTFSVGIQEDFYFPAATITITDAPATTTDSSATSTPEVSSPAQSSGGLSGQGGGGGISHIQLNTAAALAYLVSKQNSDGSFGSPLLNDWGAIAFAADDPGAPKELLKNYLLAESPALSSVTDYERHAMALMALGINPYSGTAKDYIAPIVNAFDGTQIGDSIVHDDIFAIYPLMKAGYGTGDEIIQKAVAYIVSKQDSRGSWGDPDTTGAALQALSLVSALPEVGNALAKAKAYLHLAQQSDGGFGNSFSTSWVMLGLAALNESPSQWAPGGLYPEDYLASLQQADGGMEPISSDALTRTWSTEFAIVASLEKPWATLLQSFSKPSGTTPSGSGIVLGTSTLIAATTTTITATTSPATATTTLPIATSTPEASEIIATSTPAIETGKKIATVAQPKPPAKAKVPAPKTIVATQTPATTTSTSITQTASAAASESGNFFSKMWRAITSFFASLF